MYLNLCFLKLAKGVFLLQKIFNSINGFLSKPFNKRLVIVLIVFSFSVLLVGCLGGDSGNDDAGAVNNVSAVAVASVSVDAVSANASNLLGGGAFGVSGVERVEVIHFHGEYQCYSCLTVGAYAEETVKTYFSKELEEGKISFARVNVELPENQTLVAKYGVTGSSLWIGVYDKTGFHKEENANVWYKIGDKQKYLDYLRRVLSEKLAGD